MDLEHNVQDYIQPGKRAHLVGIGGVSMSPLGEVLKGRGVVVTGSDMHESAAVDHLRSLGIPVVIGHLPESVMGADCVIRTAAVHDDNPEIAAALAAGIPVFERAQAWGAIMKHYRNALCVSGTHGKTTTTSMCTHIFLAAGKDPSVMIGGTLPILGAGHRVGHGDTIIAESCEYCNSFLSFAPTVAVILNVEEDHLDFFKDLHDIQNSFRAFAQLVPEGGAVIADGKPDEVFAEMGDVLAAGGAWVPGRAIPDYSPKQESAHDAPVLSTENLSFGRGAALGVGINLDFYPGEVTALMGPNGAGKSTLALTLAGLLKPIAGKVLIADNLKPAHAGREPIDWKSKELLGRIGMVFQEPEHQFAANFVRDEVSIGPKSMGQSQDEAYQTADRMLEQMNLTRFAKANPYTLSGGEKRRLSVASMLAAAPKVLVMDEPTFGQDFSTWNEMVKLIAAIRDQGSCVIMVTHDEALVDALGARRVMFEEAKA